MEILLFALLYDNYNQVRTTALLDRDIYGKCEIIMA